MKLSLEFLTVSCIVGISCWWFLAPLRERQETIARQIDSRNRIADLIREADSIFVVEHSFLYDRKDTNGHSIVAGEIEEYGRTRLNPVQQEDLAANIIRIEPKRHATITLAIFEPHHSIELVSDGVTTAQLEVCFSSGSVELFKYSDGDWKPVAYELFNGLDAVFEDLVSSLGMDPHANWTEKAEQVGGADASPAR